MITARFVDPNDEQAWLWKWVNNPAQDLTLKTDSSFFKVIGKITQNINLIWKHFKWKVFFKISFKLNLLKHCLPATLPLQLKPNKIRCLCIQKTQLDAYTKNVRLACYCNQCCQIWRFVAIWATFWTIWRLIFCFGDLAIWLLFGLLFKMNQKPV